MYCNFDKLYFSEKYSVYEVKVSASTSIGEGRNASNEFRTQEDSEFYFIRINFEAKGDKASFSPQSYPQK